jgi:prolyl-tRNA synthetase
MRQSALFGKSVREVSGDTQTAGHRYLYQGGFVRESRAGRFYLLPLGIRVQDKIVAIIEQEMESLGSQKMIAPILHPIELWEETKRAESVSFELMRVIDRRGAEFVLGGTAEEMISDLVRRFSLSYRDLPIVLHQFSTKFRDELRARGGVLRAREFLMKDAYSFDRDKASFLERYRRMAEGYLRIFKCLGLTTSLVEADNGYMGGEYCHEIIVESPCGESDFFVTADGGEAVHADIVERFIERHPEKKSDLVENRGIEVGNIFQLGYHYSKLMHGLVYRDSADTEQLLYMGCYGLGVSRTLGAIAEVHHDERGLIWPESVAPYRVHLITIGDDAAVRTRGEALYSKLESAQIEVLLDDRDLSAGVKLTDADLLGLPYRVVVSKQGANDGTVEYRARHSLVVERIGEEELLRRLVGK